MPRRIPRPPTGHEPDADRLHQARAIDKLRGMAAEVRLEQTVGDWL
ncbi:MAG: hypothetical protein ACKOWG_02440 [Planctomycetia bacterium]